MMDGMMGMMHGWGVLVVLLLVAILVAVVVLVSRSGRSAPR
jgi:preprotein translocase subunit SecG